MQMFLLITLLAVDTTNSVVDTFNNIIVLPDIFIFAHNDSSLKFWRSPISYTTIDLGNLDLSTASAGEPGVYLKDYLSIQSISLRGASTEEIKTFIEGFPFQPVQSGFLNLSIFPDGFFSGIDILKNVNTSDMGGGGMGGSVNLRLIPPSNFISLRYQAPSKITTSVSTIVTLPNRITTITSAIERIPSSIPVLTEDGQRRVSHTGGIKIAISEKLINRDWDLISLQGISKQALPWLPWTTPTYDTLTTIYALIGLRKPMLRLSGNLFRTIYIPESRKVSEHTEIDLNGRFKLKNTYIEFIGARVNSSDIGSKPIVGGSLNHVFQRNFLIFKTTATLRMDLFSNQKGPIVTGSLGIMTGAGFYFSISNGYRSPTFNELYWKGDKYVTGNPNLKPEYSKEFELGYKLRTKSFFIHSALYSREYRNMIRWATQADGKWRPVNLTEIGLLGFDFYISKSILCLKIEAGSSISKSFGQENLIYYPDTTVYLSLKMNWFGLRWSFIGSRPERLTGPKRLKSYTLLSLWIQKNLFKLPLTVTIVGKNLSNSRIEMVRGYPMPGRNFLIEIKGNF